jgi:hypothetical protein
VTVGISYPLFVFEKYGGWMYLIEDQSRVLYHLEAIDIENDEYAFWDSNGGGVTVTVVQKKVGVNSCAAVFPLRDAFTAYAGVNGLGEINVSGVPIEVWHQIRKEIDARPKKRSFLARIFR